MAIEDLVKQTQHMLRHNDLATYREIRNRRLDDGKPVSMLTFLASLG